MNFKFLLSIAALSVGLVSCKEPSRENLSYQQLPAYDIVKSIQNKDFEVFSRLLERGSDADQNFNNLAQFEKLTAAFAAHSISYDGWDMKRNDILSRLISRQVEKDESQLVLTSRVEEVAYDIFVTIKDSPRAERRSVFVARIYAQGKTYRQHQWVSSGGAAYWQESSWSGGEWKAIKISVPGMTNEDLSQTATPVLTEEPQKEEPQKLVKPIDDRPARGNRPLY